LPNKKKEKIEVEKKKKILTKLVVEKEDKIFDAIECQFVDDTLGNEFLGCFPFGNDSLPSVSIDVHYFKRAPPNIVYRPLSDIHKGDFFIKITQYNKFDAKVPIFAILEDSHNAKNNIPRKPKKWEDIQNNHILIVGEQHIIVATKVHQLHP
jgi:hypothetical protein